MNHLRGKILAFSGLDGGGKSTQIALLERELLRGGGQPVCFWSRGGYTELFSLLKRAMRRASGGKAVPSGPGEARDRMLERKAVKWAWLTLALLDLILLYGVWFRFQAWRGKTVLADRYLWDTWIDFKLNFPDVDVKRMILWRVLARVTPRPEVTFFLSIPVSQALHRCREKKEPFFTGEAVLEERNRLYHELVEVQRWTVVDAEEPADFVFRSIKCHLWGEAGCA